jgi:hypothetical protein
MAVGQEAEQDGDTPDQAYEASQQYRQLRAEIQYAGAHAGVKK